MATSQTLYSISILKGVAIWRKGKFEGVTMPPLCIDYGQIVKIREKGRVVDKIKRIIFGKPDMVDIETTDIENFNGILRERIGRLVRKTKCYSKKKSRLRNAIELIQFHWNFMDTIHDDFTPAMIDSLSDRIWSWNDFLSFHYAV